MSKPEDVEVMIMFQLARVWVWLKFSSTLPLYRINNSISFIRCLCLRGYSSNGSFVWLSF